MIIKIEKKNFSEQESCRFHGMEHIHYVPSADRYFLSVEDAESFLHPEPAESATDEEIAYLKGFKRRLRELGTETVNNGSYYISNTDPIEAVIFAPEKSDRAKTALSLLNDINGGLEGYDMPDVPKKITAIVKKMVVTE
jgi:hypothetical protein